MCFTYKRLSKGGAVGFSPDWTWTRMQSEVWIHYHLYLLYNSRLLSWWRSILQLCSKTHTTHMHHWHKPPQGNLMPPAACVVSCSSEWSSCQQDACRSWACHAHLLLGLFNKVVLQAPLAGTRHELLRILLCGVLSCRGWVCRNWQREVLTRLSCPCTSNGSSLLLSSAYTSYGTAAQQGLVGS